MKTKEAKNEKESKEKDKTYAYEYVTTNKRLHYDNYTEFIKFQLNFATNWMKQYQR